MLDGRIAEPDDALLAAQQGLGDRHGRRRRLDPGVHVRHRVTALPRAQATSTSISAVTQRSGATVMRAAIGISQSCATACSDITRAPPLAAARTRADSSGWSLRRNEPTISIASSDSISSIGMAEPGHAGHRLVEREVRLAQAEVDVLRADAAHQRAGKVELLDGRRGRDQRADRFGAMLALRTSASACADVVERDLPVDLVPGALLLDHRREQAVRRVDAFVGEAVAVRQPALVDRLVLERQHPHHAVVLDLHHQVRAERVVRRHRAPAGQLPGARLVAERLAGQRADRAQVDHVARQLGVHRAAQEAHDLRMLAAPGHAEFHDAADLLAEAHAAGALDAARHLLGRHQRADVLVEDDPLLLDVARGRGAVADGEVLQLAFAALVADRAVERMVDQQELHHALLRLDRLLGLGVAPSCRRSPASRRPAAAWAPSRPRPGTSGSWPRSTASCDSRNAGT